MQYCAVYINQGLNAHREAFSPAIIIEELLLQRFLHTLLNLLHTKYNTMALFSAAAAAVLDISSALMGAFVYTLERAFKNRKTAPATPPILASTE